MFRRPNRELQIFSLSALDVLAMATGAFVLLMVILLPYYRMVQDAQAEVEGVRVSTESLQAEAIEVMRAATAEAAAADEIQAEADSILNAAAAQRAAASSRLKQAASATGRAADNERKVAELQAIVDQRIIKELDLVFVVDTTASMSNVLEELAYSMSGIIRVLERLVPSLRVGVVAYRDHDLRGQLLKVLEPTRTKGGAAAVQDFVERLRASPVGGRTPQEALYDGLQRALAMPLRSGAKQSIIVIGDAAAHSVDQASTLSLASRYASSGRKRSISTLFVTTESFLRFGSGDREFFSRLASSGRGEFNDHRGALTESVLLSVLDG